MHSLRISSDDRPRLPVGVLLHLGDDEILVQRSAIDADPDRLALVDGDLADRGETFVAPRARSDVAGIDPVLVERRRALRVAGQEQVAVVVEVADQRRLAAGVQHPPLDVGDRSGGLGHVDGDSHELGPRFGELDALAGRCFGIGRIRHRHRLDRNGRTSADLQVSDAHADGAMQPHGFHVLNDTVSADAGLCSEDARVRMPGRHGA